MFSTLMYVVESWTLTNILLEKLEPFKIWKIFYNGVTRHPQIFLEKTKLMFDNRIRYQEKNFAIGFFSK